MYPDPLPCARIFTVISSNPYTDPETGIVVSFFQMRQPRHMLFKALTHGPHIIAYIC